jgi:hypothetical protein
MGEERPRRLASWETVSAVPGAPGALPAESG